MRNAEIDRPRRVVQGDDQLERCRALEPSVARAVLMQRHARQRPPLPLAPVRPLARRLRHKSLPLQLQLRPGVAPAEAVILHQTLVEALDGEALIALAPPLPPPGRSEPACPKPCPAFGRRDPPRPPRRIGASSAGTSVRSLPKTPPPLPSSVPPIPSGRECSKTPPCAPPEGPPSGASQPLQKGADLPDRSCAA